MKPISRNWPTLLERLQKEGVTANWAHDVRTELESSNPFTGDVHTQIHVLAAVRRHLNSHCTCTDAVRENGKWRDVPIRDTYVKPVLCSDPVCCAWAPRGVK
jgi:hypothetical protein